jgi:nitroreductase
MEFMKVVGTRRSIRYFKTWETVPKEKIQRILEVVRLCTSPGNTQPWRAVVVYRNELPEEVRNELLAVDHWQGAHTQAPVWIYWYGNIPSATSEGFAKNAIPLIGLGAAPRAYGWDEKAMKAAIEEGIPMEEGAAAIHELLHSLPAEISAAVAVSETVGACGFATLAAVNEGLGTCLHMISAPSKAQRVKEILNIPDDWVPVWCQLVGYPAESPEAGGQRPREDWDTLFHEMSYGKPFPRDEKVVEQLKEEEEEELIQAQMPLPGRKDELRFLARMYGYPELD